MDGGRGRGGSLTRGEHRLPFEFLLPEDCPASTPDLLPPGEREYAYVGYRLKARITQVGIYLFWGHKQ